MDRALEDFTEYAGPQGCSISSPRHALLATQMWVREFQERLPRSRDVIITWVPLEPDRLRRSLTGIFLRGFLSAVIRLALDSATISDSLGRQKWRSALYFLLYGEANGLVS